MHTLAQYWFIPLIAAVILAFVGTVFQLRNMGHTAGTISQVLTPSAPGSPLADEADRAIRHLASVEATMLRGMIPFLVCLGLSALCSVLFAVGVVARLAGI